MPQNNRATLPLPKKCPAFAVGRALAGSRIEGIYKEGTQVVLFRLQNGNLLRVYYAGETAPRALRRALKERPVEGVCPILKMGKAGGHEYDVIPELSPLPDLGAMDDQEKKMWIKKQVKAVQALHRLGYLHLDLKPEHFMQDGEGKVFLVDLGSARKKGEAGPAPKTTPGFAPPEREAGICEESYDWYSFGICLADELGGGVYPDLAPEEVPAVLTGGMPPTRRNLAGEYRRLVKELVRVDKARRYHGDEILRVLDGETVPVAEHNPNIIRLERRVIGAGAAGNGTAEIEVVVAGSNQSADREAPRETLYQWKQKLRRELVRAAKHADATVFARQVSGMRVDWANAASVQRALDILRLMPRSETAVNATNITQQEAEQVFGAVILTDFSDKRFRWKTFNQKLRLLREGQDFYVASKAWIAEEERHRNLVVDNRKRQGGHVIKAAGIGGLVVAGVWLFIQLLPYLLVIAILFALIGAL